MSRKWWNKNEHIRWEDYRYRYHELPLWAQKWGNWLSAGHITDDEGDPVDEYTKLTVHQEMELPYWPTLFDLNLDPWQMDFQHLPADRIEDWLGCDHSCLTGPPVPYRAPQDLVDLGTGHTLQQNIELYQWIGFLRPARNLVRRREAA